MATLPLETLYKKHVRKLSVRERLQLITMITQELGQDETISAPTPNPKRNIMELHGLGKEIWMDVEPQEYVNQLREEWNHRP